MNQTINNRINALRGIFGKEGIAAFIVPSTDPHLSEYVAPHWQSREWISGFTGSAGTVVVTREKAGLWTDSRYFLQAARQLEGSGIDLYKEMLPETPCIPAFLSGNLKPGEMVGIDGAVFSAEEVKQLQGKLEKDGISVKSITDPMNQIWADRPAMPEAPAYIYETKYAGKSSQEKIAIIREEMKKQGAEALLISALDEIAWTEHPWQRRTLQSGSSEPSADRRTGCTLLHPASESYRRTFCLPERSRSFDTSL